MSNGEQIDSSRIFRRYFFFWNLLGLRTDGTKPAYGLIDILITFCITIVYPVHLMLGLMYSTTSEQLFRCLIMNIASCTCSLKQLVYRRKLPQMQTIADTISRLDKRIQHKDDRNLFQKDTINFANNMMLVFFTLYSSVCLFSLLAILTASEWRLIYPAWIPFDWHTSLSRYIAANGFQYIGLLIEVVQNYVNDVYGPINFCLYAGHIHHFRLRVARSAHDMEKTVEERQNDLITCMQDYNDLMRTFFQLEDTVSMFMLLQIASNGLNIGLSLIYILFYADSAFSSGYNILQLVAFFGEMFPCCYYGSVIELEFQQLPYAISISNWLEQPRKFRRDVLLFATLATRTVRATAMGMFNIHISAFFGTCKMAYSMFTLILTMKR